MLVMDGKHAFIRIGVTDINQGIQMAQGELEAFILNVCFSWLMDIACQIF